MTTRRMLVAVAAGLVLAAPKLAKAEYKFTTIDMPGGIGTIANANSQYKIAGEFDDVDGSTHGFVLSCRGFTQIDVPHAVLTVAEGINNAGQIVGLYVDANGNEHGFVLNKGVYTTIDIPHSTATAVYSINARGEIVGEYVDADGVIHGYVGKPSRGCPERN